MRILCFISLVLLSCLPNQKAEDDLSNKLNAIRYEEFHEYLKVISGDEAKGRATGTAGFNDAATYAIEKFKSWGLIPAGENGTFYQKIPFAQSRKIENSFSASITHSGKNISLRLNEDIALRPLSNISETNVSSVPIVFAGYGIDAPELGYSDYEGIDVKGKVVLVALGTPSSFNNEASAIYSFAKQQIAFSKGAVAVLTFSPAYLNLPLSLSVTGYQTSLTWTDRLGISSENNPNLLIIGRLDTEIAENLISQGGQNAKDVIDGLRNGQQNSFDLNANFSIRVKYEHHPIVGNNVVALLSGTDEKLKNELVVVTAHLDHLGIGSSHNMDSIYNGTIDNASGSAALLTLASAFAKNKDNKRSLLFLLVDGEEKGLLGSEYFVKHPTASKHIIVANHNMDGLFGMITLTKDIIAFGYEHSNLSSSVDFACKTLKLKIGKDLQPEEGFFVRSDQYSFVKGGIPAIWIGSGNEASDSTLDAHKRFHNWLQTRYHNVDDDLQQPIDKKGAIQEIRFNYLLLQSVANRMDTIRWDKDSYLFKKYVYNRK